MNCDRVRKLLPLQAGGDLPEDQSRIVAGHVESCADCRSLSGELSGSLAWLHSTGAPPVSESDYAELRRAVWRRIESGGPVSASAPGDRNRLALAGAGLLAAVLAAILLVARAPRETPVAALRVVASPVFSESVTPAAASRSVPAETGPPRTPPESASAAAAVAGLPPKPRRHRPPAPVTSDVDRIEFRTANPNVRIIWLVRKAEEKSSSLPAGRNQEVS